MSAKTSEAWIWLRWPLVPIVIAIGCVFMAGLFVLHLFALPWLMLYPEVQPHLYDYGNPRQREAIRRWRAVCRRVPLVRRLKRLLGLRDASF
jgi:hypothetical protein